MEIINCVSFPDYLNLSKEVNDKVGFLTLVFQRLHPHAPKEELRNPGGQIAGIWAKRNKDTGYVLKVIWDTSSHYPVGNHLDYIRGMIFKNSKAQVEKTAPELTRIEDVIAKNQER